MGAGGAGLVGGASTAHHVAAAATTAGTAMVDMDMDMAGMGRCHGASSAVHAVYCDCVLMAEGLRAPLCLNAS